MPYSFPEIRNFAGLYKQANSFTVPDGALEEAKNVVLTSDRVIKKVRGFYEWYDPGAKVLNNLFVYNNTLIAVYEDQVAYFSESGTAPNKTGSATVLTGATVAVTGTRVSRAALANKNLYFTTDNGVIKLESTTSTVYGSGVPPALDLTGRFLAENGEIAAETQVAYRVVFGRRDANGNLLLGAPSDILVLTNQKVEGSSWVLSSNVVTVTTTEDHNLSTGMQITVSGSDGGTDEITDGTYTITGVPTPTTFTFAFTGTNDASGNTLDYTATRNVALEFSVPGEIDDVEDGYFVQIYRASQTSGSTVSPNADFKLADEHELTAAEISANLVLYNDTLADLLLGAELYTNPNSREGELQANHRAPLCDDLEVFKNHLIYAKIKTRHLLDLDVVAPGDLAEDDYVEIKVDSTTRRYVAREGVGNSTVQASSVSGTGTITITYASHGLETGDTVYISRITGTLTSGTYTVSNATADTFDISATGKTATALDFQGVTDGTHPIFKLENDTGSAAVNLRETAQALVKAINRDSSSLVYARYVSTITGIPGKMRLHAKGFTGAINVRANSADAGGSFSPVLPASFDTGTQVFSRNDDLPNTFAASKRGEPEAVPLTNLFPVGSRNMAIFRVVALRDSAIFITQSGVYRMTGDSVTNFQVTPLDDTVICVAPSSVKKINNQVVFLSNQGVCLVTESSVEIISRDIEDLIQPIVGDSAVDTETSAVAYESDRIYHLSTLIPNGQGTVETTRLLNVMNRGWTDSDFTFKQGVVGPSDTLFLIDADGRVQKERKNNTRVDYCGQNYSITVTAVASDLLSATITSANATPEPGWVILSGEIFSRITAVTDNGGNSYTVTFRGETNLSASDSKQMYASYQSTVRLAPFHAGLVGRAKQWAEFQIHTRQLNATRLTIWFSGQWFDSSDFTQWDAVEAAEEGWGEGQWGSFEWGNVDSIDIQTGTLPAPPVRLWVPKDQQRSSWIQPVIEHNQAGESLSIQAVAFAVRSYGQRVAR